MKSMRSICAPVALALTLALVSVPAAAEEKAWFDLEKCAMCKNMSAEEGLMEHMQWENHLTQDGMMSVTMVAPGYEEAFGRAMASMEATSGKLMTGEKMNLCGFCQSHGSLVMAGANFENFQTGAGYINLVTARDPAVIEKIHAHGQRTIDEYNKMVAMEGEGHGKDHEKKDH